MYVYISSLGNIVYSHSMLYMDLVHIYCIQTLTRYSWIHYTDCWIVK